MRVFLGGLLTMCLLGSSAGEEAKSAESYIDEARDHAEAGDLEAAIQVMHEAVEENPDSSTLHAVLGLYLGQSAGQTEDFRLQSERAFESFEVLDRAVELDSMGVHARFYRGLMGVKVPEFLGRREQGIKDLKTLVEIHRARPGKVSDEIAVSAHTFLAEVYEERGEKEEAKRSWRAIIELAPESEIADRARDELARLPGSEEREETYIHKGLEKVETRSGVPEEMSVDEMLRLGRSHMKSGECEKADEVLKKALTIDSTRAEVYVLCAMAVGMKASRGYDEAIAEDRNLRVNMCFETMEYLDKAVSLAPEDMGIRLLRGATGVNLPFFVGRLDGAVTDLEQVIESSADDSLKAEALYHLGVAHRKKGITHWVRIVTDYPDSPAAQWVFESMRPQIGRVDLSRFDAELVVVDLELGFQEELPPQMAVWVEDGGGDFVKTLYVSGYAGHVGGEEVTLPTWSGASDFETDATTGASVDVGRHAYMWDLTDGSEKRIEDGEYIIRAEVSYWPSMQHQVVSATIEVGGEEKTVEVEEGKLIPYLGVKYLPRRGE